MRLHTAVLCSTRDSRLLQYMYYGHVVPRRSPTLDVSLTTHDEDLRELGQQQASAGFVPTLPEPHFLFSSLHSWCQGGGEARHSVESLSTLPFTYFMACCCLASMMHTFPWIFPSVTWYSRNRKITVETVAFFFGCTHVMFSPTFIVFLMWTSGDDVYDNTLYNWIWMHFFKQV